MAFRIRVYRVERPRVRTRGLAHGRVIAAFVGLVGLLSLSLLTLPADAATSGSNAATVTVAPALVRSLTVTPPTSTFGNCSGGTASELAIPNGTCSVGQMLQPNIAVNGATGGVTVTNGSVADQIDVNGGPAAPTDAGTPWTLTASTAFSQTDISDVLSSPSFTPLAGPNQFEEEGQAELAGVVVNSQVGSSAACDGAFTAQNCSSTNSAASGASTQEILYLGGPSSSTDAGPFTVTTTWTAAP